MNYYFYGANERLKLEVWRKGRVVSGFSPAIWRYDVCGRLMKYSEHGNTASEYGWEIDHAFPKSLGGSDNITNLQPLNWLVNRYKGDNPNWSCPV